jgi:hypothetical protein
VPLTDKVPDRFPSVNVILLPLIVHVPDAESFAVPVPLTLAEVTVWLTVKFHVFGLPAVNVRSTPLPEGVIVTVRFQACDLPPRTGSRRHVTVLPISATTLVQPRPDGIVF